MTVTIIVAPIASSPGRFMAKLANDGDVLVRSSRTPFLDAARRLLEFDYPVDAVLVMRHARSAVESLRAKIGKAAALTVTTAGNGRPIFVTRSVAAVLPVRSSKGSRHNLAPRTEIRTGEAAATGSLPIAPTHGGDGSSSPNGTPAVNTTRATRKGKEDGYANVRPDTQNGETTMTNEEKTGGKADLPQSVEDVESDQMTVEQWLAIRKEAARQIDPETAEVEWMYAQTLDPYGVNPELPEERQQVGREYFARSPGSEVWVWFGDLPEKIRDALWEKHKSHLAFPVGLFPAP
jgi:hypothetical protein